MGQPATALTLEKMLANCKNSLLATHGEPPSNSPSGSRRMAGVTALPAASTTNSNFTDRTSLSFLVWTASAARYSPFARLPNSGWTTILPGISAVAEPTSGIRFTQGPSKAWL